MVDLEKGRREHDNTREDDDQHYLQFIHHNTMLYMYFLHSISHVSVTESCADYYVSLQTT